MKLLIDPEGIVVVYADTINETEFGYECNGCLYPLHFQKLDMEIPQAVVGKQLRIDGGVLSERIVTLPQVNTPSLTDFESALDAHLDAVAQSKRYNDRFACALRAGYPGPFHNEGVAFATWMDSCNAFAYQLMMDVQAGNVSAPSSIPAFIEMLPEMVWPL